MDKGEEGCPGPTRGHRDMMSQSAALLHGLSTTLSLHITLHRDRRTYRRWGWVQRECRWCWVTSLCRQTTTHTHTHRRLDTVQRCGNARCTAHNSRGWPTECRICTYSRITRSVTVSELSVSVVSYTALPHCISVVTAPVQLHLLLTTAQHQWCAKDCTLWGGAGAGTDIHKTSELMAKVSQLPAHQCVST